MNDYEVIQILDVADIIGEDVVLVRENAKHSLNASRWACVFSCPQNSEIENFLKKNAVDFARKKMSITHLIFNDRRQCVAYFTLTHKSVTISNASLSKNAQKKIAKHAKLDEVTGAYAVSAFLIA